MFPGRLASILICLLKIVLFIFWANLPRSNSDGIQAMITPYYETPLSKIQDEHDDGGNACTKEQVLHSTLQLHTYCTLAHAKQVWHPKLLGPHCRQASVLPVQASGAPSKSQKKKAKAKAAAARKQAAAEAGDCSAEQDGGDDVGSEGPLSSTATAGGACL